MRDSPPAGKGGAQSHGPSRVSRRSQLLLGIVIVIVATLMTACYPGVYPFDVFPEMHYQPSYRPFEPPRLAAPAESVPITGIAVPPPDFTAASDLRNPVAPSQETTQRAEQLFKVNCLPCHGPEGRGNGLVAQYFERAQLPKPADFASARLRALTDGQLFFVITNGFGNMPAFGHLLTVEERWYLVVFIRGVQAKNPPS